MTVPVACAECGEVGSIQPLQFTPISISSGIGYQCTCSQNHWNELEKKKWPTEDEAIRAWNRVNGK